MNVSVYNVRDYGADRTGKTLSTLPIQKAIDECARAGGGTVFVPPGRYVSGMLLLKSNITLHLEAGAHLLGSPHRKDYLDGSNSRGYLLFGEHLTDVRLTGRGIIDGNGPAFWTRRILRKNNPKKASLRVTAWAVKDFRPRAMIHLVDCRRVTIDSLLLKNSPCYALWLLGCDDVLVHGISLTNYRQGLNTDGIDLDCCGNVRVANCHIDTGDDCICLKSDITGLGRNKACENVTVTNCTLSSACCAVRIGYEGDGPIRNAVFSNLAIDRTHIGIDLISILPDNPRYGVKKGAPIENILFSDIVMNRVDKALFLWMGNPLGGRFLGRIRNITFNNIIARQENSSYIGGCPERWMEAVALNNVKLVLKGAMKGDPLDDPGVWAFDEIPHGLYCRYVHGLSLNNLSLEWENASGKWLSPLCCRHVRDLDIVHFQGRPLHTHPATPAMDMIDTRPVQR